MPARDDRPKDPNRRPLALGRHLPRAETIVCVIGGTRADARRAARDSSWGDITVVIPPDDPNAPPIRRPPSSREIARRKAKAEEAARAATAARALTALVRRGIRPPTGKLWGVDVAALMIIGPRGGIGTTAAMARILAPLAAGGRHAEADVAAATGCRDVAHLREVLAGMAGKLAAVGLRVDRRKAGIRMAKVRPAGA